MQLLRAYTAANLRACIRSHTHAAAARVYTCTYACSCCFLLTVAAWLVHVCIRRQLLLFAYTAAARLYYVCIRMQLLCACIHIHTYACSDCALTARFVNVYMRMQLLRAYSRRALVYVYMRMQLLRAYSRCALVYVYMRMQPLRA